MDATLTASGGTVSAVFGGRAVQVARGCSLTARKNLLAGERAARAAVAKKARTLANLIATRSAVTDPRTADRRGQDLAALDGWLAVWDADHERAV